MVEILCTAFSYKELYKKYQKLLTIQLCFTVITPFMCLNCSENSLTNKKKYDRIKTMKADN